MKFKKLTLFLSVVIISLVLIYLKLVVYQTKGDKDHLYVVCTTNIIADTIKNIAGDKIHLEMLMGPGVDPHLYKPIEQDITKIAQADIIFYNGLHLEARMADLFETMSKQKTTIAVCKDIPEHLLLKSQDHEQFFDPHVWFDPLIWIYVVETIASCLQKHDPKHTDFYKQQKNEFIQNILDMYRRTKEMILEIPVEHRILITGHDAFEYFGRSYSFKVIGLQGINTASEAGTKDVQDLANFIYNHKVPALFLETSTPSRNILALEQNVEHKGFKIHVGAELYSDALGDAHTSQGTYIGMMEYNAHSIVQGLKTS